MRELYLIERHGTCRERPNMVADDSRPDRGLINVILDDG
jgi:hypothetical protein